MTRANFIGAPEFFNLQFACRAITEAFGFRVYLVGSAIEKRDFRDVDIRCILEDEEFEKIFPNAVKHGAAHNARLALFNAAISEWSSSRTGLKIDFQFQQQTKANQEFTGQRQALGFFPEPTADNKEAP